MKKMLLLVSLFVLFHSTAGAFGCKFCCDPWSGFYIGANTGRGWCHKSGGRVAYSPGFGDDVALGNDIPSWYRLHPSGMIWGAQFGYNEQVCCFLVGLEADIQKTRIKGKDTINLPGTAIFPPTTSRGNTRLDWFSTIRGRMGYCFNKALIYGTFGWAFGHSKGSATMIANPTTTGNFIGHRKRISSGWALGTGVEYALLRCIRLKVEYLYADLKNHDVTLTDPQFPGDYLRFRFRYQENIIRAGINFHL